MWPNQHFHVVEAGIVGDIGDLDLGHRQWVLCLGCDRRALVLRHVLFEPLLELELQVFLFLGGTDVLSLDNLQVVGKATHKEEIREARRQPRVGGGVGVDVLLRLLTRVSGKEAGIIPVLIKRQGHETQFRELELAPLGHQHFCGDLGDRIPGRLIVVER